MKKILTFFPELQDCYTLKEQFRTCFTTAQSVEDAATVFAAWCQQVDATPYKALHAFAHTFKNWRQRILNFFDGRYTNAFVEGVNLKIKLILRRGFGYPNFSHFHLHVLGAFTTSLLIR